jgi:membrane protease YdiL (CAAX protease family)
MKSNFTRALLTVAVFLLLLWTEKPLREWMTSFFQNELTARFLAGVIVRTSLIILFFYVIRQMSFTTFSGLNSWRKAKNLQAIILALLFVAFGFTSNINTYGASTPSILILFMISVIAVGVLEEFVFRGIVFPLFIQSFQSKKYVLLWAAFISSFLFGSLHYMNLFSQPGNFIGITSQVFFATSIGVFFCGLMARTENIFISILIHALINFSFGAGALTTGINKIETTTVAENGLNWNSIVPTSIFFLFIMSGGVFMLLKSNKTILLRKLGISNVEDESFHEREVSDLIDKIDKN